MTEDFRWVTLSISAIINLQKKEKNKTVHFGRIFMGTRSKEAPRQLQSFTKIDWSSSKKFQILDDDEGEYELEDLSPKNTTIVQLFKAEMVGPEIEIEEVGFSIIPVIDDSNFPIVGLYALPVFQSHLTDSIIDYLSDGEAWDVMDSINEDIQFRQLDMISVVRISDQYRQVSPLIPNNTLEHVHRCLPHG